MEAPMRYLLLIYTPEVDPATVPADVAESSHQAYGAFTREIRERGVMEAGEALQPTPSATTVRIRDGRTLVTDGPFAETKEQIGGFFDTNLPDLDTALELAGKIPASEYGSIEVRPVVERP
jgi:hypothetical protein